MTSEELAQYVDRQKEINRKAKEQISKALRSMDLSMILTDRAKARTRFIRAVVKYSDKFFTESLNNGRDLKRLKLGD